MRPCLLALTGLFLAALLSACGSYRVAQDGGTYYFDRSGVERSDSESGAFEGTFTALEIDHRFGSVNITASDGPAGFEGTLSCWGRTAEDAARFIEEIQLEHTVTDGTHRLRLVVPKDPGPALRGIQHDLTIRVPASTRIDVREAHGRVSITGITDEVTGTCSHSSAELRQLGMVRFETSFDDLLAEGIAGGTLKNSHGSIHVTGVSGDLNASSSFDAVQIVQVAGAVVAENSHGELEVEDVSGSVTAQTSFAPMRVERVQGSAHLRNSHGRIRARGIEGEIDAESSFDTIQLETAGETVKIENSHGDVELSVVGRELRRLEAETSFGDLRVKLPAGVRPAIFVDHRHGDIRCPMPYRSDAGKADSPPGTPEARLKVRHGDLVVSEGAN